MNAENVKNTVERVTREVAALHKLNLPELNGNLEFVDGLGFTSLMVAELIANLEEVLGLDPFQDENVMITDIRTIKDLCTVYTTCLQIKN